jgi:hypothetical protein
MLEIVEDASLLRGSFTAGCYTFGTRRSWHVNIRFEGKSGHLERVEMIGGIQGVSRLVCWLHN